MKFPPHTLIILIAAALTGAAASAQQYPVKPIRVIVPFTPGGRTDNIARVSGHKLGEAVGAQVVIDNRGGAGSANGWTGRCNRD